MLGLANMSIAVDFKTTDKLVKISFVVLLVACFFSTISFSTTGWALRGTYSYSTTAYGLWKICVVDYDDEIRSCSGDLAGTATAWLVAVQALVIFGFSGIWLAFMLVVRYIWWNRQKNNKDVLLVAAFLCLTTGLLYLIGCIVFAAEWFTHYPNTLSTYSRLHYGFGQSVLAIILEITGGVNLLNQFRTKSQSAPIVMATYNPNHEAPSNETQEKEVEIKP